jgi:hypothetical protein
LIEGVDIAESRAENNAQKGKVNIARGEHQIVGALRARGRS